MLPAPVTAVVTPLTEATGPASWAWLLIAVPALSMRAALGSPADHPLYADLARSLRLPLFADGWSRILARSEWRSDAVHPNATGYAHFAHALADWARQNGLL